MTGDTGDGSFGIGRIISTIVMLLALASLPVNALAGDYVLAALDIAIVVLMAYLVLSYWPRTEAKSQE